MWFRPFSINSAFYIDMPSGVDEERRGIHNHIVYNSTTLDATHKYKNFFLSSFALRRLSDLICLEHGMSVIPEKKPGQWQKRTTYPRKSSRRDDIRDLIDWIFENKMPKDMEEFLRFMIEHGYEIKRGKYISVKAEGQKNFLRLRSLGNGYTEEDIARRIGGELVVDIGCVIGIRHITGSVRKKYILMLNMFGKHDKVYSYR